MLNKHETKSEEDEQSYRIKVLMWNVWSIFVSSPRCLTNPSRCSDYILDIADKEKWTQYDGLIVCGFQELWRWNTSIIPSVILSDIIYIFEYIPYIGSIISRMVQLILLIFGAIPIFKIMYSCYYCPKQIVINKLSKICKYNYYDNSIPLLPIYKISDNGLLLLFNTKPDITGSQRFDNSYGECSMVSKGFIYAFFKKYNTLFIMTHMQYTGPIQIKKKQLNEIIIFRDQFKSHYGRNIKIMIFGDFNCDLNYNNSQMAENEKLDPIDLFGDQYQKVNTCSATTWDNKCIDHIFVNHNITKYTEQIVGRNGKLSDHWCVINDFYSH